MLTSLSVSDTGSMSAKEETGAVEKATDCGFGRFAIESGKRFSTTSTNLKFEILIILTFHKNETTFLH